MVVDAISAVRGRNGRLVVVLMYSGWLGFSQGGVVEILFLVNGLEDDIFVLSVGTDLSKYWRIRDKLGFCTWVSSTGNRDSVSGVDCPVSVLKFDGVCPMISDVVVDGHWNFVSVVFMLSRLRGSAHGGDVTGESDIIGWLVIIGLEGGVGS